MAVDVFRPSSVGRALRTAFVLGLMIVIALVASVEAYHQFDALVGDNTKDELSRYLDDNAHTTAHPSGAGFKVDFPVPPSRLSVRFATSDGTLTVPSDHDLVDGEVTFDAVWVQLPGKVASDSTRLLSSLVTLQVRQYGGTKIGSSGDVKVGRAIARDVVFVTVDRGGEKHYYDERVLLSGRSVWILRVGSRIRRDAAFEAFVKSFVFTS